MTSIVMFNDPMRAARLLQILLILQNRGRQTSVQLADELEVATRTILRDVDAMTEAGLPIIVHQGRGGGIELGFNYRTRLTGLDRAEAEALGVMLSAPNPAWAALGLSQSGKTAIAKLIESFPDGTREQIALARDRFQVAPPTGAAPDPRIAAIADAIRNRTIIHLRARSPSPATIFPVGLTFDGTDWSVRDARRGEAVPMRLWGDINISARPIP